MNICYKCQAIIDKEDIELLSRNDSCQICGFDLHCCLNCQLYDIFSYNDCKEIQAETLTDKEKANFCDFFKFKETGNAISSDKNKFQNKENPLDDLFKK